MKYLNFKPIIEQSADQTSITSAPIDLSQIFKISAQIVVGAGTVEGSVKLQVSNDEIRNFYLTQEAPVNWSDLGSPSSLTTTGAVLVSQQDVCYRALRVVYSNDTQLENTITAVADVAGSLNSTYFLLDTSGLNYYVWLDNGTGVDPAVPSRTGIQVTYTNGATADTIAGLIRTALAAVTEVTVTGATNQVITTDDEPGTIPPAEDGADPTGFTFANNAPTADISVNLMALAF